MLQKTSLSISTDLIKEAQSLAFSAAKITLNEPTGLFFYDPWIIKQEFKDSVWQKILEPLGNNIGEARIIVLDSPSGYTQHADIDDRYHLNIIGEGSYLLDLTENVIYPLTSDGIWYEMDAGRLHSAVAIGKSYRIQLVVRKLLNRAALNQPVSISISGFDDTSRYDFDNKVSPWLNRANKKGIITDFAYNKLAVTFDIECECVDELTDLLGSRFDLTVTT